jgi:hypothetical protein
MIGRLIIMILAVSMGGCATVARGTDDQMQILSDPSGARVTTSLSNSCVTPCTIQVSRKDEFTVAYELEGYERQEIPVKTQIAGIETGGFAGNTLLGGVIGLSDATTGANLEHVPNPVRAVLVPIPPAKNDLSGNIGAKRFVVSTPKKARRILKPPPTPASEQMPIPPPAQQSFQDRLWAATV